MLNNTRDVDHIKRVKKVAIALNIPEEVVELALFYTSEYIKNKISEIKLPEEELTEAEFNKICPTIKLPGSVGYLKPSYKKYKHINKHKKNK